MTQDIEQFKRIEEIFESVINLPLAERQDYLEQACKGDSELLEEVKSLLDEDALREIDAPSHGFMNKIEQTVSAPAPPSMPQRIGNYRIIRECGHGGMGTVYEAVQDSPERRVALKMIRPGMMTRQLTQRFRYETEFLGRLQHAGVGQIFEAGVIDLGAGEQPYFVMEFIDGAPLLEHIRQAELSTTHRLMLFVMICDAIQHAHQRGVIHRDLKPENILVVPADNESAGSSSGHYASMVGQPKVLDFGIARAIDADVQATIQTDAGALVGTLQYMSPEQAAGNSQNLDVRSDIYALGVILFEVLCDRPPYDLKGRNIAECVQIIREQDPSRLSSVHSRFRGDLETIVGKCLEKDPDRRYASASDLAGDVRRHMQDEPITARPPDTWYQLRKFSRRNRQLVIGVIATVVALTAGLIGTAIYALRADEQRDRAVQAEAETKARAEELETVTEFQQSMLSEIDAEKMGRGIVTAERESIREAMESEGVEPEKVDAALAPLDELLAKMNATNLALKVVDEHVLARAVETIDKEFADQPVTRAAMQQTVADTYKNLGIYDPAIPLQESALATRRQELGDDHPDTLNSINNMGMLLGAQGKLDEAEPYYHEALKGFRRVLGNDHPDTLRSVNNIGFLLKQQDKLDEAMPYYREALDGFRRVLGDDDPGTLALINNMGMLLRAHGKLDEAMPYLREAMDGFRRVMGDDHPETLIAIDDMGNLLRSMGKLDEAESYYREALDGFRRVLGDDHPETLITIAHMGVLLQQQDKLDEEMRYSREALDGFRRVRGDDYPGTLALINNMGVLLRAQGKLDEAMPYLREALDGFRRVLGDDHPNTLEAINNMGNLLNLMGRHDDAAEVLLAGESAARRVYTGGDAMWLGHYLATLGEARSGLRKHPDAEATLLEAHGLLAAGFGDDHARTTRTINQLITLYDARLGDDHARTTRTINQLITLYDAWHAAEPGKGHDTRAAEWKAKLDAAAG